MRIALVGCVVLAAGCGGGPHAAPTPPEGAGPTPADGSTGAPSPAPTASGTSTPTDAPEPLPSACAPSSSGSLCVPPSDFVDRLCAKPHQDVALALFRKASPFTRLYLRGKLDELTLDEEVLALRFRGVPKGGVVVGSGAGSYDVLRWDGSCSTGVEAEMLSHTRPSRPRTSGVKWHRVSTGIQDALIASSESVKRAHARRGKECKGAMSGDVSAACEKADRALADAIVDYVREGGSIPEPDAP